MKHVAVCADMKRISRWSGLKRKDELMRRLVLVFVIACAGASGQDKIGPWVKSLVPPVYPAIAATARLEGTVDIKVLIDSDGKVESAHGTGPQKILDRAAEENIRQWVFYSVPHPVTIRIRYVYKLVGRESYNPRERLILDLPDRVEIVSQPVKPNP
jgi:TonB family protein